MYKINTLTNFEITSDSIYQVRISDDIEDAAWDAFIAKRPDGHHVQTSLWVQVKQQRGRQFVRITILWKEQIVAGAQIILSSLPLLGTIGYVPKGPIYALNDPDLTKLMIAQLHQIASEKGIQYLVIQPHLIDENTRQILQQRGFQPSLMEVAPSATVQIDLRPDLDEIMAAMKKRARKYIRRGLRDGLIAREGTEADIPTFHHLLSMTGQRQGFIPFPESYYSKMWQLLHPRGYLKLFLVEYEGEAVSAQIVVAFGDTVIGKNAGWSGQHRRLGPNHVMDWTTIQWAKAQGYRYYDLEGFSREAAKQYLEDNIQPDPETQGPAYYKLNFGGDVVLFSEAYDYVYNPLLRVIHSTIFPKIRHWSAVKKLISYLRTA